MAITLASHGVARLTGLLESIADETNDPNGDAADAVTVLMTWRRETSDLLKMLHNPLMSLSHEQILSVLGWDGRLSPGVNP